MIDSACSFMSDVVQLCCITMMVGGWGTELGKHIESGLSMYCSVFQPLAVSYIREVAQVHLVLMDFAYARYLFLLAGYTIHDSLASCYPSSRLPRCPPSHA